jgi:hypothetical protein
MFTAHYGVEIFIISELKRDEKSVGKFTPYAKCFIVYIHSDALKILAWKLVLDVTFQPQQTTLRVYVFKVFIARMNC